MSSSQDPNPLKGVARSLDDLFAQAEGEDAPNHATPAPDSSPEWPPSLDTQDATETLAVADDGDVLVEEPADEPEPVEEPAPAEEPAPGEEPEP